MDIDAQSTIQLKASLLSHGIDFDINLFQDIRRPFYDNQFVYGQTSARVTPTHRFPQVLLLGDGIVTALLRRPGSPWSLRFDDGELTLYWNGRAVRPLELPERPTYFGRHLSDGTPSENIIAVAGEDTPGFFLYPECCYFDDGTWCRFCSMRSTRRTVGRHMVSRFSERSLVEATRLFQQVPWRPIPLVSITTGTPYSDEEARVSILEPLHTIYSTLEPKIPIHLLAHPPDDLNMIAAYRDAGVTSIAFNIEVFDRNRFAEVCPGKKRRYGYDKWIEALTVGREVFGDYKVYCGLVWGLEPVESTICGHQFFLERGIGLASNVFHADPRTPFRDVPHPSTEDILRIAKAEAEMLHAVPDHRTIFSVSMRSTVDWEVQRGDLKALAAERAET